MTTRRRRRERRLPKIGFLTTDGFHDILDRGTVHRPLDAQTDPAWRRPFGDTGRPLVPRYLRRGVLERMSAAGEVLLPLVEQHAVEQLELLRRCAVQGVAICLLHAYADAGHEVRLRELVQEVLGTGVAVSISSETSPLAKEYGVWTFPPSAPSEGNPLPRPATDAASYRAATPVAGVIDEDTHLPSPGGRYHYPLAVAAHPTAPMAVLRYLTNGGGGWDDPFSREPDRVRIDVRDGYVSIAGAARDYGVVVVGDPDRDPEGLVVDEEATAQLRAQRRGRGDESGRDDGAGAHGGAGGRPAPARARPHPGAHGRDPVLRDGCDELRRRVRQGAADDPRSRLDGGGGGAGSAGHGRAGRRPGRRARHGRVRPVLLLRAGLHRPVFGDLRPPGRAAAGGAPP